MGRRQTYRPNTAIFGRNYHTSDIRASVEHSYQRRHNCTFLKKYYHSPIQQTRTCIFSTVFISTTHVHGFETLISLKRYYYYYYYYYCTHQNIGA